MTSNTTYEKALELLRSLDVDERKKAFSTLKREREDRQSAEIKRKREMPPEHWSRAHLLHRLPNPSDSGYEQKIHMPELTFVGTANQPDFGEALLTFYPGPWTIELKSLKVYKDAFRDQQVSYERLANVMFEDLLNVYEPLRLRLMMRLRPRGGIASCLTIDSDWRIRGGSEEFSDWMNNTDRFGFEVHNSTNL